MMYMLCYVAEEVNYRLALYEFSMILVIRVCVFPTHLYICEVVKSVYSVWNDVKVKVINEIHIYTQKYTEPFADVTKLSDWSRFFVHCWAELSWLSHVCVAWLIYCAN